MDLPQDGKGKTLQLVPPESPIAKNYLTDLSSAQDIELNAETGLIEVTAIDNGVFVRFVVTASSTNYDRFVGAGQTQHIVVPTDVTDISLIEETSAAKAVVLEYK